MYLIIGSDSSGPEGNTLQYVVAWARTRDDIYRLFDQCLSKSNHKLLKLFENRHKERSAILKDGKRLRILCLSRNPKDFELCPKAIKL